MLVAQAAQTFIPGSTLAGKFTTYYFPLLSPVLVAAGATLWLSVPVDQVGIVFLFDTTGTSLTGRAAVNSTALANTLTTNARNAIDISRGFLGCAAPTAYLCFIFYSLPGNIDYPWSAATNISFQYNPNQVTTAAGAAVQILSGTGTRTYTNRFGNSFSTGLSIDAPTNASYNLLYLNAALPVDGSGFIYNLSSPTQLSGDGPTVLYQMIKVYANQGVVTEAGSSRVDGLGSAYLSNVPGFTNTTIGASNINALAPVYGTCSAPITFTNGLRPPIQPSVSNGGTRLAYSYSISDGVNYTVAGNLTIFTSSAFANLKDQLANPYQIVTNVTGTRLYTFLPTGATVFSTVSGLSLANFPYASQRFYPYSTAGRCSWCVHHQHCALLRL